MQNFSGKSKEEFVHGVFSSIAHRYDLLNTTLSFNRDKYWRRFAVEQTNIKSGAMALDVACGTGMLSIELAKIAFPTGRVIGLDFCENMLAKAVENIDKTKYKSSIELVQGNAMELPFEDNTFDCATIGFALRNVPDVEKCIDEMRRVVKPGGRVVSLELAKPSAPVFKQLYYLYFDRLVPLLGKMGVGKDGPYQWLPNSLKIFPHQSVVRDMFSRAGLKDAVYHELTGGIVAVHVGIK
ncbi:demethylmenaquinone methyltransferase [Desulforamulus aquiferis]|uniref:Demethylmenaquinone methyltransferase n=1 Tax=Desulforamulus aquiferis TaxID=1397668 RepID=A0AAW7Z886_9FIRM|nr:demethylmenaquinone methyltransferase [Desulforamulus aquiferis]MDO7785942.1 demethylmenaquinone methyltransferase [Desulforamulus aquiferis]RYD02063.1 ubiquinone/menaquinone biosynthesis methyltransferase [Desulforamulus aquiferis]